MSHRSGNVERILAKAVEFTSADERERFLVEACCDDSHLRRKVVELIDVHFAVDRYLQDHSADEIANANLQNEFEEASQAKMVSVTSPHIRTLGDFQLVREIGRGGMGVVYEAVQISLNRRVALKVFPFAAVLDQRQLQRFKTEAQAAAGLHHGNIVPVYQIGCERAVHFYAMQYIEGQNVAELIRELRQIEEVGWVDPVAGGDSELSLAGQLLSGPRLSIETTTRDLTGADEHGANQPSAGSAGETVQILKSRE